MILVTGAAGKSGRAVLGALRRRGRAARALIRRVEQEPIVRAAGASEVAIGDMREERDLRRAATGARAIYHIAPNMSSHEERMGAVAMAGARTGGVSHFVYHSVLHPQTEKMAHHWSKLRVEEALLEVGIPFTIMQPAAYMQNILGGLETIQAEGAYPTPYPTTTELSLVDLQDVGEAAAAVLCDGGHAGAIYELVGTAPLTQNDVAAVLSRVLKKAVHAKEVALEDWERKARESGLPEEVVDKLLQMFRYYAAYGFTGNPKVLSWLLGRSPTSLQAFLDRALST